jgi:hypothetical protein
MTSRHLALLVAVCTLPAAAPAGATVLVTPDGQLGPQPYQSWVDTALVPTPPGEVVLSLGGCPGDPPLPACSPVGRRTIELSPDWASRRVFLHELGHVFDDVMPDWARGRFRGIVPGRPADEQFAEAYALCALHLALRRQAFAAYDYAPTPRLHRRVCALVRAAGQEFGE